MFCIYRMHTHPGSSVLSLSKKRGLLPTWIQFVREEIICQLSCQCSRPPHRPCPTLLELSNLWCVPIIAIWFVLVSPPKIACAKGISCPHMERTEDIFFARVTDQLIRQVYLYREKGKARFQAYHLLVWSKAVTCPRGELVFLCCAD
jgi:hypothetical protein